jgi:hypothetical protein
MSSAHQSGRSDESTRSGWRKIALLAGFALLVLGLAAWFGSGSSSRGPSSRGSTASSTTVSARTSFVASANSICTDLGAQAANAAPSGTDLPSYATSLTTLASVLRQERAELGRLTPPVDATAMFRSYLAFLDREISSAVSARAAAATGDQQGFTAAMQGLLTGQEQPSGAKPAEMVAAENYGLTACAR